MRGIYLHGFKALHPNYFIDYQDINGKRDIGGDMMDIDLDVYDFIIATPPCNYYSKANYRRETSEYSQKTKHLLPDILDKLWKQYMDRPWIVENVMNKTLIPHFLDNKVYVYKVCGHTYWTNIKLDDEIYDLPFIIEHKSNLARTKRQGGYNVHLVVELFLKRIHSGWYIKIKNG